MAKKHVFPLFLEGATQSIAASGNWNGTTSKVEVSATSTITVGDAEVPGTIVQIVANTALINVIVNFTNAVSAHQNSITMLGVDAGYAVIAMWNGSAWVALSSIDDVIVAS